MTLAASTRGARPWGRPARWAYLGITPWLLGLVLLVWRSHEDADVAARQHVARGTVMAHEPQHHDRFGYTFAVDGRSYHGWDSPVGLRLGVGQPVTVYYDPADPATNALTDFGERHLAALGPVPLLAVGVASVLVGVYGLRRRAGAARPGRAPGPAPPGA